MMANLSNKLIFNIFYSHLWWILVLRWSSSTTCFMSKTQKNNKQNSCFEIFLECLVYTLCDQKLSLEADEKLRNQFLGTLVTRKYEFYHLVLPRLSSGVKGLIARKSSLILIIIFIITTVSFFFVHTFYDLICVCNQPFHDH